MNTKQFKQAWNARMQSSQGVILPPEACLQHEAAACDREHGAATDLQAEEPRLGPLALRLPQGAAGAEAAAAYVGFARELEDLAALLVGEAAGAPHAIAKRSRCLAWGVQHAHLPRLALRQGGEELGFHARHLWRRAALEAARG
eukprot:CAMPEP_0179058124 /NCGR_PEP_ID=MMETSP0796-20121207/24689_1 /TAXON_ID=73915 /ORGANISM="Pyrodinium bahamense, Strain pbaha01" /LENGTH=143 /DNA_ID=CAMNT_0020754867 /DNA_START=365 /DNA_END=795 /DNA_ORIENTATION=-